MRKRGLLTLGLVSAAVLALGGGALALPASGLPFSGPATWHALGDPGPLQAQGIARRLGGVR